MPREFHLRAAFEPTRLSAERLQQAYDVLVPVVDRARNVVTPAVEPACRPRTTRRAAPKESTR